MTDSPNRSARVVAVLDMGATAIRLVIAEIGVDRRVRVTVAGGGGGVDAQLGVIRVHLQQEAVRDTDARVRAVRADLVVGAV